MEQHAIHHAPTVAQAALTSQAPATKTYTPLALETRSILPTREAAHHLNRAEQTLRLWAINGGPITPTRINGRLGWRVSEIKQLLGVA